MSQLFPPTIEDQIAEVERELKLRRHVYPRHVAAKKMSQPTADRHITVMEAVLDTLRQTKGGNPPSGTLTKS